MKLVETELAVVTRAQDGLVNVSNNLVNQRNPLNQNRYQEYHSRLNMSEMRALYKHPTIRRIVEIKTSYALNDSIVFDTKANEKRFNKEFKALVKQACANMLYFGRALIIATDGQPLNTEITDFSDDKVTYKCLSGEYITVFKENIFLDLNGDSFFEPEYYHASGLDIHRSRVVDFSYILPPIYELQYYNWGGMSESELLYNLVKSDDIVQRSNTAALEKNSTMVYKLKDLYGQLNSGKDETVLKRIKVIENMRSIYGAAVIDAEDDAVSLTQTLGNLQDADSITLRRLALGSGIPVPMLVGENVQGLNTTGDNERDIFNDTITNFQQDYVYPPLAKLFAQANLGELTFNLQHKMSPDEQIKYEQVAIQNAQILEAINEGAEQYLKDKNINTNADDFNFVAKIDNDDGSNDNNADSTNEDTNEDTDNGN